MSFTRAREYQIAPDSARVDSSPRTCGASESKGDRLCGEFVFVQQPAEPVATAEAIELRQLVFGYAASHSFSESFQHSAPYVMAAFVISVLSLFLPGTAVGEEELLADDGSEASTDWREAA
jgi:hypothetical protein